MPDSLRVSVVDSQFPPFLSWVLSQLSQVGFQRVLGELGLFATPQIYYQDSRLWCGIHSCKQLPLQVPLPKVPMILTSRISVATFRAALLALPLSRRARYRTHIDVSVKLRSLICPSKVESHISGSRSLPFGALRLSFPTASICTE